MVKTTRQHILEFLERKGAASPVEIAHALHLTPANIRHHLTVLERENAVEAVGIRRETQRGRPGSLYSLKSQAEKHNLDNLSSVLLIETLSVIPEAEKSTYLRRIARRLCPPDEKKTGVTSQRLVRSVNQLNDMNYSARWEARPDSPRVILGHCPYLSILPEHPELCRMDAFLLEELLDASVEQTARLEQTPQGLRQCVFALVRKNDRG